MFVAYGGLRRFSYLVQIIMLATCEWISVLRSSPIGVHGEPVFCLTKGFFVFFTGRFTASRGQQQGHRSFEEKKEMKSCGQRAVVLHAAQANSTLRFDGEEKNVFSFRRYEFFWDLPKKLRFGNWCLSGCDG